MIDERRRTRREIGDDLAHIEEALRSVAQARAAMGDLFDERTLAEAAAFFALYDRIARLIGAVVEQQAALRYRHIDVALAGDDELSLRYLNLANQANATRAELSAIVNRWAPRLAFVREAVAGSA